MSVVEVIRLNKAVEKAAERHSKELLALGWCRYEALRKLSPRQFEELRKRNIAGERFDDMVDELVAKETR